MGAVWPSVCRNEMSGQRLEVRRGVYIPQVKTEPFRSTSEVPTQISGLPTLTENTVHKESEVSACKSVSELSTNVGTSDVRSKPNSQHNRCRDSRLGLGQCRNSRRTSGLPTVGTPGERRDFRRAQTASQLEAQVSGLLA